MALNHITSFQAISLHEIGSHIYIIWRREVVEVAAAEESVAIWENFKNAIGSDDIWEIVFRFLVCCLRCCSLRSCSCSNRICRAIEDVVSRQGCLVFDRDVNNSYEICTIAWVATPNTIWGSLGYGFCRLVALLLAVVVCCCIFFCRSICLIVMWIEFGL